MKLHVDKEADALYLRLDDSAISESEEVAPGVVLDYNERNEVVGVEMLRLSKRASAMNLSGLEFHAADEAADYVTDSLHPDVRRVFAENHVPDWASLADWALSIADALIPRLRTLPLAG